MERRREPRFESGEAVEVRMLGEAPVRMTAQVINISGRGLKLLVDRPLPVSAPIRVDWNDAMLLGEVCYSVPEGERHAVGVVLDQVLHESPGLMPLIRALAPGEAAAGSPRPEPAAVPRRPPR